MKEASKSGSDNGVKVGKWTGGGREEVLLAHHMAQLSGVEEDTSTSQRKARS